MSPARIDELNLETAVEEECATWRNLLPKEPWIDAVMSAKSDLANFVRSELEAGLRVKESVSISARKAVAGTRPVPILDIVDRVAYRAITNRIFQSLEKADRSQEAYKKFLEGPIDLAFSGENSFTLASSEIEYVVESDIVAFYEYIDHTVLQRELELQTGEIEFVRSLIQLVEGVQGRKFGLPQLLDPSDWLSDVYIQVVERDLLRRGLHVYRYNDDFRIPVREYADALDAIELLEECARDVGLVISGHKTFTPSFINYLLKNTNLSVTDESEVIDPTDVEVNVTEYPAADEDESIAVATDILARLEKHEDATERIDIANTNRADVRELRRAIYACTRHESDIAIGYVQRLFHFVPSLTPRLTDYLVAMHPNSPAAVDEIIDHLVSSKSLSEWQAMWVAYAIRAVGSGDPEAHDPRGEWLAAQRHRGRGRPLAAEVALSQAARGEIKFQELDTSLRMDPEALNPWFIQAIGLLGDVDANSLNAVKNSSPLYKLLLSQP